MKTFIAATVAALLTAGLAVTSEAVACSPPSGDYRFEEEIPETIPVRGALPVVFNGSSQTRAMPLEDPGVTFEVRNSNDKLIPGDAEVYTLTLRTSQEWGEPRELEHQFTAVDASGDVAAPTVDSARLSVREDRAAGDCCVPNPDVVDSCTGQPVSECWTTEFEYTPFLSIEIAPVPDDIWASQTLLTVAGELRIRSRASTDSTTRFSRDFALSDESFCLTPRAVRIADGSFVSASDVCRDQTDLPDYEQRDADDVVSVPSECRDQVDSDAGGGGADTGPDAGGSADAGPGGDDTGGGDAVSGGDAGSGDDGDTGTKGSNELAGESSGCGCASSGSVTPASVLVMLLFALGWTRRRR